MKVMRQGSELHGLANYINKYNWLCVFFGARGKENPALRPGFSRLPETQSKSLWYGMATLVRYH